jgi:hypothetical protein
MHSAAADLSAVILHPHRARACPRVRAPGDGRLFDVRTQVVSLEIAQLILAGGVHSLMARSTLEADYPHAGLTELRSHDGANGADTRDDDVCLFVRHGCFSLVACSVLSILPERGRELRPAPSDLIR